MLCLPPIPHSPFQNSFRNFIFFFPFFISSLSLSSLRPFPYFPSLFVSFPMCLAPGIVPPFLGKGFTSPSVSRSNDDPFEGWDFFSPLDGSDGDFDASSDTDPFSMSSSAFSSSLKLISPGLAQPATSHVADLPVRDSTWKRTERKSAIAQSPIVGATSGTTDSEFEAACNDQSLRFNPRLLGFIPTAIWPDEEVSFGHVVSEFFQRKNNANCRFPHKLFNALRLTEFSPDYPRLTGLQWLNDHMECPFCRQNDPLFRRFVSYE
jgi:hypothetical protein